MPDNLQTHAPDKAWNHPRSLGLSIWQRHTSATLAAARTPLVQRRPGGFEAMYERHASFVGGPLARQINQARPCADPGKFVFGMNQGRGPRYRAAGGEPAMQELPAMRYSIPGGTAPARNWRSPAPDGPSLVPTDGKRNDPATGSAGLSAPPRSTFSRVLAPEDQADSRLAQVAAASRAEDGPVTVERTGQRHIARKAALPGNSQTADASANNTQVGDAFSESKANGYQEGEHTQMPLPALMDAAEPEVTRSHSLSDGVSSRMLVQRSIPFAFAHRHSVDLEPRPRLPLTSGSGVSGVIARQLQDNGSGGMAGRPLESYRLPSSRLASMGFMPGIAPSGGPPSGQIIAHHNGGRIRRDERVLHRLPGFSPVIATHRDTLSTQSSLRLAPMHLTGTSRLAGPALQPLNGRFHRPPEKQPVGDGLPITRSVALQRLPKSGAPETPSNLPDAPCIPPRIQMSPRQAHQHGNVPILRETITQSAGGVATSHYAAATGGTDAVPHMDRPAAHTDPDPASHIPLRLAAAIPHAQPVVQRLPGNGAPWVRWDPWKPGTARYRNMPSSTQGLSQSAPLRLTEAIRPSSLSRSALQSPREPITRGIHAPLRQANRHEPRQYDNLPVQRKTIAPSSGNIGMNYVYATSDIANAVMRLDHSTAHADRFSNFTELPPPSPHGQGRSKADFIYEPTVTGDTQASGALSATAAAFSATPSAIPGIRRLAAGVAGARPMAQRRLQNNLHSIASAPQTLPDALHRRTIAWSTGHEGTSASNAGIVLPADTRIADDQYAVGSYQEVRGAYSGWTPGAAGRPLMIARRTGGQLMRASGDAASASAYSPLPATSEDRHGVVPAPREGLREVRGAPGSETSGIAAPSQGEHDPDEIAEQAWRIMMERLVIEQERRGLAEWNR